MALYLQDSHRMIRDLCRNFVKTELVPRAAHIDKSAQFPAEMIPKLAELGLMGMFVPEELGGAGLDRLSGAIAIEELAQGCASTALIVSVHNSLVCGTLIKYGSQAQKKKWLPDLASGKKIGCFCLTEHDAGSDAAAQSTRARQDGDGWVLNGSKTMITNAPEAGVAIVFARSDERKKAKGITAFVVPMDQSGITVSEKDDKLGVRGASTADVIFKDVRVPADQVIYQPDAGFMVAMSVLSCSRIGIAAQALGIAQAAFDAALSYAREREQFGQAIFTFQGIQWMLSDMATEIEAARLLVYRAASATLECQPYEASVAKLFASEVAMRVATSCVQIHGGYGFIKEFAVERHYRDAKVTEIYGGTSEIQRHVIASQMLKGEDDLNTHVEFSLTPEQEKALKRAQDFARKWLAPVADQLDREGRFNREALCEMGRLGFLTLAVPKADGGLGLDPISYLLTLKEFGKACAATTVGMAVTNMVASAIGLLATPEQKKKYIGMLTSGQCPTLSFALTESHSGSDATALQTTAQKTSQGYVITGNKQFVTSGAYSGAILVFARTSPAGAKKSQGISAFLVDKGTPGLSVGKEEDKMGIRASNTVELVFDACEVPASALLGKEGEGINVALSTLDNGRMGLAAKVCGIAQAALEAALSYAHKRRQFGKALNQMQAVQSMLADMRMELDAAFLLTLSAAQKKMDGENVTLAASMAKLYATEAANRICLKAVQIHGGVGYTRKYPVERYLRDCKVSTLYEGTSEIQRLVIARHL